MITIQLLGGACLRAGDAPIMGPPAQRHRIALLALIVAAWPQPVSRDRAMALLWPERDLAGARRLLNLAVHVLRSALGEGAIGSAGDGLLLDPSRVNCDLHQLRSAIAANAPERIVQLYTGPLLDGFHLTESSEFGYWLDEHRSELAHAYIGALLTVAQRQEHTGDLHGRIGTCRRLVAADPHSGVHALALMEALDAAGDRAGALQHAAEHARRLATDLRLEPDPAVKAMAERLRAAPARRSLAAAIAVLPFLNLSGDAEHEYFTEGITEDVIAHLSRSRTLQVIARASTMAFRQRQQPIGEIARRLSAGTVLDGSVRWAGDRVRIVVTLVEAATGQHRWNETYDRQVTDIFAVQTEVALQIAAALEAELSPAQPAGVRKEPTRDVQAYRLFLQGRRWLTLYSAEGYAHALEYFERALARDPDFALAWADLAITYTEMTETGAAAATEAYQRAAAAAANALRLDPELSAAHVTLGFIRMVHDFDWAAAEQAFKRALELSPSNADAYNLYGRLCAAHERYDEAVALLQRAQELDPLAHRVDIATGLLRAGRYVEATRRAEEAVELDPEIARAHATLGWAYFLTGRREEGVAELERAVALSAGNSLWLSQLGEAYAMVGQEERAREILRQMEERARSSYVSAYHFAYIYAGLGEADRAMDFLERAVAERAGPAYGVKGSFLLASLHGHPRFRALLRQMNLE